MNPTKVGTPSHTNTKAELMFDLVFCNSLQVIGTNVGCGLAGFSYFFYTRFGCECCHTDVGHGPVMTLFLSLILFPLPHPIYIMLYYVMLAKCQHIDVHDGLAWVGCH